jgi:hypothetical protein
VVPSALLTWRMTLADIARVMAERTKKKSADGWKDGCAVGRDYG